MKWIECIKLKRKEWHMDVNTENVEGHFSLLVAKNATGFIIQRDAAEKDRVVGTGATWHQSSGTCIEIRK